MDDNKPDMKPDNKPEVKPEDGNGKLPAGQNDTNFKIAEIWLRDGKIMIDAPEQFWSDRCRALGVLEFCKDIVKQAQLKQPEPKIIPAKGSIRNFVNSFKRKR